MCIYQQKTFKSHLFRVFNRFGSRMHIDRTLVCLLLTVLLVAILPNIEAEISSFQINSTDHKTDCFERGINIICFKKFLQPVAETLNDTSSSNFLNALLRKINSESDTAAKSRHRRKAVNVLVRRELRAGPYETNFLRYALAVRRLKNHFGIRPDMSTYDIIAVIHTGSTREHRGPAFFSWHRIYLLLYEAALQSVFGRGVTVPYWDSSLDEAMGNRQARTILFSNKYFGTPFGEVTDGFFANLPGMKIRRNIGATAALIPKNGIAAVLTRTSHSQIVRRDQRRYYWEGYHDRVHRWVDGTMASGTIAAFDPIFWCHHAFVDYVWELFRKRISNAPADYPLDFEEHPPEGQMRFNSYKYRPNPPITNREGFRNKYARLRRYAPAPSCQNLCSNSQDLYCNGMRDICVSLERVNGETFAQDVAAFPAFGVPQGPDYTTLQAIQQAILQDMPAGMPLNLFDVDEIDPNTRGLSVFDV
ncbi:tyrosinase-like protein 1 isoform X1 [Mytilus californianus]|uniref:tyrosinase-like protein 1 isoform X1 n=1 Tax=Mytilus californianus TaxID=6549 RepID=UPI0022473BED|nr:tyrosinase-like protein 1 isoform X1 [Mytilus californianus]